MINKNILGLSFFGLVVILLFGCTNSEPKEEVVYENYSNQYFFMQYPSTWNVVEHNENGVEEVEFLSKLENKDDELLDGLIVSVLDNTDLETFEDFKNYEKLLLYETQTITSSKEIDFKDFKAAEIVVQGKDPETKVEIKDLIIYLKKNDKVFRISRAYQQSKEDKYTPSFEKMMESLKITYVESKKPERKIEYITYNHDKFSIGYPSDWSVDDTYSEQVDGFDSVLFRSRIEDANDKLYDEMVVEVYYLEDDFKTFDDFKKSEESILYEEQSVTSTEETTLTGYDALKINIEGNYSNYGTQTKDVVLYFVKQNKVFRIDYAYEASKENKYLPVFEKMLENLKVK